ncbi:MAG: sterol desaturase [Candidatus Hydrogenedens sp.]|nr:sterol desaturase [Candidatus Hydrogenedens sp.]
MSIIVYAIPVFFIMIAFELGAAWILKKKVYRLTDSINDLSMGMVDQVGGAFLGAFMFGMYLLVWKNFRIFDMGAQGVTDASFPWWVWVSCFLAKDFGYYWAHRMSHEMNIGWATHIAHHQSEEYNLSVALRQGVFQGFFFNFFYIPLALVGFPPVVYGLCSAFNTLYQFWIHTRTIGKLGPLEWVLNTPSHHRVHHGRDEQYIDRNHAGVFIIWDRMFGTFEEEKDEPNYGLVGPLRSWNPLWGQVHYLVKLVKLSWYAPKWRDKIYVWFAPPAYVPEGLETNDYSSQEKWKLGIFKRYETSVAPIMKFYALLHFTPMLLLTTGFLRFENDMTAVSRAITGGLIMWTLLNVGGVLESRRWLPYSEGLRILAMGGVMAWQSPAYFGWPELVGTPFQILNGGLGLVSLGILITHTHLFQGPKEILPDTDGPYYTHAAAAPAMVEAAVTEPAEA